MPVVSDFTAILYVSEGQTQTTWSSPFSLATPVIVTYSFLEGGDLPALEDYRPYWNDGYSTFTSEQRANFRDVADIFEASAGIILVEVPSGEGMVNIMNTSGSAYGGWANIPYSSYFHVSYTDNYLVVDNSGAYDEGSYGFTTMLHELGHAMGLQHPFESSITLDPSLDNAGNTVMTYNNSSPLAQSLGVFDIQALQFLYGLPVDTTDWRIDFADTVLTVYGSNGADAITGASDRNALFGGDGDDTLNGRTDQDSLSGGSGHDRLNGLTGDDLLYGDAGNDTIFGYLAGDPPMWSGSDKLFGGEGDDLLFGQEAADTLHGGKHNDRLYGDTGLDSLTGGLGDDRIYGGDDADRIFGDDGDDFGDGGLGSDTLFGREGRDTLLGQDGADLILTGASDDRAEGGAGQDSLRGDAGADTLRGGDDNDTADGGSGNDLVDGSAGHDRLLGGDQDDLMTGGTGNDTVNGNAGRDTVFGGDGDDVLAGESGRDRLDGGAGADTITGGADADLFVFRAGSGRDLVLDFTDNLDTLRLDRALWTGDLTGRAVLDTFGAVDSRGRVVLDFGDDVLVLAGIGRVAALVNDLSIV